MSKFDEKKTEMEDKIMANNIFISYNHNDDALIDMIARRLNIEFGKNNIFYDAWSMQPGDSIIGKMNEGLEEFTTFFFFVSPNSLSSRMVSLEWQTALNRAINNDLKFVAVKIADCKMPAILSDKQYIDLYSNGIDDAVEKMKCIVKSENNYRPLEDVQNLKAKLIKESDEHYLVRIEATTYTENGAVYAFACENDLNDFFLSLTGSFMCGTDVLKTGNGKVFNARTCSPMHMNVRPGFSLEFVVVAKQPLKNPKLYVLRNADLAQYEEIEMQI